MQSRTHSGAAGLYEPDKVSATDALDALDRTVATAPADG
jgi:hypothetical protein